MIRSRRTLTARLADAVDLALDFATLGEYGLEPVAAPRQTACETRRRPPPARGAEHAFDRPERLATRL
jgi:hypothetical protein